MSRYWIVVEWNQASSQPTVAYGGDLFYNESDAEDCAEQLRTATRVCGRRERHTVHEVDLTEVSGDELAAYLVRRA